jgi:SAM-dependent methyltransferase/GNAT superfamily N-acetyltransferase
MIEIQALNESFQPWANRFLAEQWGTARMVTRGRLFDLRALPGFVAVAEERPVGLLTYHISEGACEIMSLNSGYEGGGVGSALIEAARETAEKAGCWRLWLITTNDNSHALRFYQKRGFVLAAVHRDSLREARRLKPEIPFVGLDGIPLRDEIELEIRLASPPAVITRLNHAQVTIPKGEEAEREARRFYCDLMGLKEKDKPDSLKGRGGFWTHLGHQQLHVGTEDGVERNKTKAHLAYEVPDLSLWRIRFRDAGVSIEESVPIPGYDRFEIRDPFGNRVEFIQPLPDTTRRFSDRVRDYVRYRPDYPAGILPMLVRETAFSSRSVVADIGSGTGKLAVLFLDYGNRVYGVEPNEEMRRAAEELFNRYDNFTSVKGTAEATGLPDKSVDVITAGQAFHWFDVPNARIEFRRILKPGGRVVLVWNQWSADLSPLLADYQALLTAFSLDANRVRHTEQRVEADMAAFFGPQGHTRQTLDNRQVFDFAGFKGRLLSSSYAPLPGHPSHEPMVARLREIFDKHQRDGLVVFDYKTHVYYGEMGKRNN